jgi:hypothetical protein
MSACAVPSISEAMGNTFAVRGREEREQGMRNFDHQLDGGRHESALGAVRAAMAVIAAIAAIAIGLGAAAPALAQGTSDSDAPARALRGLLSFGLTRGGDTLIVVGYRNLPETTDIRAGQQIDLRGGIDWRLGEAPFALQASVGYLSQSANGVDGRVRFERWPVEVQGVWQPGERWRVGGGVRYVGTGRLLGRGVASGLGTIKFKGKVGAVVEGEWLAKRDVGFALRYVHEEYEAPTGEKLDGNHFGIRLSFYF